MADSRVDKGCSNRRGDADGGEGDRAEAGGKVAGETCRNGFLACISLSNCRLNLTSNGVVMVACVVVTVMVVTVVVLTMVVVGATCHSAQQYC